MKHVQNIFLLSFFIHATSKNFTALKSVRVPIRMLSWCKTFHIIIQDGMYDECVIQLKK